MTRRTSYTQLLHVEEEVLSGKPPFFVLLNLLTLTLTLITYLRMYRHTEKYAHPLASEHEPRKVFT